MAEPAKSKRPKRRDARRNARVCTPDTKARTMGARNTGIWIMLCLSRPAFTDGGFGPILREWA
ncbi:hypothetical protein NBRC116596_30350 [Litorivita sp. NS0012-18]